MNSFARLAALAALVSTAFGITIDTPSESGLVVCQPFLITWHDGVAPYFPTVVAPGPGQLYKQFDQTDATSLTWKVDLPVGTVVNLGIKDSTGAQQYSASVTIKESKDTSCLNAASNSASASSAPTTGAPGSSSAAPGASTTGAPGSSTKSTAPSSSGSKSSAAASASSGSSNDNGAMAAGVSTLGVAAVMGFVGAALF
jgi:hypothetical protein